jgi:hypothetical protein
MTRDLLPDPDWYVEHVVIPGDLERHRVGPVRARQGWWTVAANRLAPPGKSVAPEIGLALDQGLVLTTGQLRTAGYSASRIHRLVRRGRWTRCGPGVLTPIGLTQIESGDALEAELRKHCLRTAGALLRRPGHVAAGAGAAILHGLPVLAVPDLPQLVAPAPATTGRRAGAHVRRGNPSAAERSSWAGAPVLNVAAAVLDLACLDPRSGLMAADAALHEQLLGERPLATAVANGSGRRGIRRAREVLALADPRIESPLESLTHLALHDAGFPRPDLQMWLIGADGRRYRVDFYWPEQKLILEADGLRKYRTAGPGEEKRRERALRRAGYDVERVIWSDVVDTWPETAVALRDYFA